MNPTELPKMEWVPFRTCVPALATSSSTPTISPAVSIPLRLGDEVYVFEQSSPSNPQWYRGYLLTRPSLTAKSAESRLYAGIFPASCVTLKQTPVLGQATSKTPPELPLSLELSVGTESLPIVEEISATLQEWCPDHMQSLFHSRAKNYHKLNTLASLISDITAIRKSLVLGVLTDHEQREAVKSAVWDLVRGNKLLSGEVIVRDESTGRIRTGDDDDLVEFFRQQQILALSTHGSSLGARHRKATSSASTDLLHLRARIVSIVGNWEKGMSAKIYLASKTGIVSEPFGVSGENIIDEVALFVDLPVSTQNDDVYLVIEIYETIYMTTHVTATANSSVNSQGTDNRSYTIKGRRGVALGMADIGRILREKAEVDRESVIRVLASTANDSFGGWGTLRQRLASGRADGLERSPKLDRFTIALRGFTSPSSQILRSTNTSLFSDVSSFPKPLFTSLNNVVRDDMYITIKGAFMSTALKPKSLYFVSVASTSNLNFRDVEGKESKEWSSCVISKGEQIGETFCVSPLSRNSDIIFSVCTADGQAVGRAVFPLWVGGIIAKDGARKLPILDALGLNVGELELSSCLVSTELSADATILGIMRWRKARFENSERLLRNLDNLLFAEENEVIKVLQELLDSLFGIMAWKQGDQAYEDAAFAALVHVLAIVSERPNVRFMLDEYMRTQFNYPAALPPMLHSYQRLLANPSNSSTGSVMRELLRIGRYVLRFIVTSWNKSQAKDVISIEHGTYPKILQHVFHLFCKIVEETSLDMDSEMRSTIISNQTLTLQFFSSYLSEIRPIFNDQEILDLAINFMDSSASGCAGETKLSMHRLVLLQSLSKLWLFRSSTRDIRSQLVLNTVTWIKPYFLPPTDSELASLATWNLWKERIRLSCSVLAQQFSVLWRERKTDSETCGLYVRLLPNVAATFASLQNDTAGGLLRAVGIPKFRNEFSGLFPESYPFPPQRPVDSSVKKIPFDEVSVELTYLLAVLSEFATYDSGSATTSGETLSEAGAITLMSNVLQMCHAVLTGRAFPTNWLSIYMFLHRSVVSCLEFISLILLEYFVPVSGSEDKYVDIWYLYFNTLAELAGSEALEIENFTKQKRRAVWTIAGDVRERSALLLTKMWNAIGSDATDEEAKIYGLTRIGGFQTMFGATQSCGDPRFFKKIVGLWASRHEMLRTQAVGVLKSMLICEWKTKKSLADSQRDIIDALDELFQTKLKAETFVKSTFVDLLYSQFPMADDPLTIEIHKMLGYISHLLDLLMDLHTLPNSDAYNDDRILCTINLMRFLKDLHREDTFIKYVHQLIHVQELSGHYAEAGLTLGLHTNMYDWNPHLFLPALAEPDLPPQSSFARREALTLQMVKYFQLGRAPELVLEKYKELATIYETVTFDMDKLSNVTGLISNLYKDELSTATVTKQQPHYFRVIYQGLGFHRALRGRQFVVQGGRWEKLAEFADRLQNIYPDAKVVTTSAPSQTLAGRHLSTASSMSSSSASSIFDGDATAEGQFLQITAVVPEPSPELASATGISPSVRDFFLRSNLQTFSVSRPAKSSSKSVNPADVWVEKTVIATKEKFPTILRRSEVVSVETVRVSPLANAVQLLNKQSGEILHTARRAAAAPEDEACSTQLSMLVSGSVDAPVNGGVQQYRNLLDIYGGDPALEISRQCTALKTSILDYVAVLKYSMLVHSRVVAPALRPLHESLSVLFERNFRAELRAIEEEGRMIVGAQPVPGIANSRKSEDTKASLALAPQQSSSSVKSAENSSMHRSNTISSSTPSRASATATAGSSPNQTRTHHASQSTAMLDHKRSMSSLSMDHSGLTNSRNTAHASTRSPSMSSPTNTKSTKLTQNGSISSRMGSVARRFSKLNLSSVSSSKSTLAIFREED